MKRAFEIRLEKLLEDSICVRIYSKEKLELRLSRIKAFYEMTKSDDYAVAYIPVYLDNSYKVISFWGFPKLLAKYSSLDFIVKDRKNKAQYAVQLPLNGAEVKYTQMVYEEF